MPARSRAQFRFMQWRAHGGGGAKAGPTPSQAKEFVAATPSFKALPERVKKKETPKWPTTK
jgi:hypothetical protein